MLAHDHGPLRDAGQPAERGLDLAQFDAEPPQLDLAVVAPEVDDVAVGEQAHPVAGAVQPRADRGGRLDEAFGVQFGPVQVAARDARATDVQLAVETGRDRLAGFVEHVGGRVGDRAADRNRRWCAPVGQRCGHLVAGGERGGLGRAVAVDQAGRAIRAQHAHHRLGIRGLATEEQVAHAREGVRRGGHVLVEQGRGDPHRVDAIALDLALQRAGRQQRVRGDDRQPRAVEQRAPDLEGCRVERRIRGLADAIRRADAHVVGIADEPRDRPVRDHHALGFAGGSRRVHDVGEVLGPRQGIGIAERLGVERRIVVDAQQLRARVGQSRRQRPLGERHARGRIGEHEGDALVRVVDVDRYVGAARLQDAEHRDDHRGAALQVQRDQDVGADRFSVA